MGRILLNHIEKRYGKEKGQAVKDFNLEILDGEFLVMVGPSGCGKSTTLRMIAGLEDISSGELYIGDQLVNHLPPKDRDIAMVFQNYALYPNMSVYENIAFGLRLRKMPKHEIDLAVKKTARILEIEQFLSRKPKQLSGGQRQRVALGRAIVRNPQVFLMDEPLSNLDAKLRVQMRTEIIRLHKQLGVTMVYVTHDQVEAMTMGHRIVVMKDGIIQQVDTPQKIYNHPRNMFVAGFIGTPPINLVEGQIKENADGELEFHTSRYALKIPAEHSNVLRSKKKVDRNVILGIRCENVHLEPAFREANPGAQIVGIQKINELMGADLYLYMDIGAPNLFIVRTRPEHQFVENEKLTLTLAMNKALFFDKDTMDNLAY
ncbi:sn-glycerol-3-phosphate ABC transporter ATP-binding protein UgpC [Paenibacillus doosanensis]|uniref:Trehalose import ATP-binding protein SugC n=1 Tax=Paenibacillus konkukensis TaxID=2020716 RepID=A0ABY4RHH3_9BACL|nr:MULTISPECIES: sn-glycerol-3-phosphate ABC transporter ATP-binding protein UgpC [Paenibacillus]MCS7459760.1 sn-glycerol-3-phosphate ABC transporter ATP-binding protein UgpC [Paenibacillus doosanensis]UQZ81822.1 Trehalose import ATP-binding protein SugC [Paenibacillus konkukensis]